MEIKVKLIFLFFSFLVESDQMTLENNSSSKNYLQEIEQNQILGMDCSIYSNSIEAFISEYKQMFDSLNIACQLHLKTAAGKLKSTVDEMVGKKLDEYIASVDGMKSKLIEMKKYQDQFDSLKSNLTDTIKGRNDLNEEIKKYQSNLKLVNENLTEAINSKQILVKQMVNQENIFNQSVSKYEAKFNSFNKNLTQSITMNKNLTELIKKRDSQLESLDEKLTKTLNEKRNLTEVISIHENQFNQSIVKCREDLKSKGINLTEVLSSYDKNISTAERVIEFLNFLSDDEEIIRGYRLIFDQMIKNQHIYSTLTTTIAYRVYVNFDQKYKSNENLIHLKARLPQSLKNFPWKQAVYIQNVKLSKSIDITYTNRYQHDNLRSIAHIETIKYINVTRQAMDLIPVLNGKYFHIKHKEFESYLYADTNEFAYDSNRRAVFSWREKNQLKETGHWQLEPIEGSQNFKIKNIYWNEYLSVAEEFKMQTCCPRLFTLRSGECGDDNCNWNFLKHEWNN